MVGIPPQLCAPDPLLPATAELVDALIQRKVPADAVDRIQDASQAADTALAAQARAQMVEPGQRVEVQQPDQPEPDHGSYVDKSSAS